MVTPKSIPNNITDQQIINAWEHVPLEKKIRVLKMFKWDKQFPINTTMMYNGLLHLNFTSRSEVITK